jgi:hypothetical protein
MYRTGGKGLCLSNHQKDVEKRSDTLKKEGWWTGTPQTIDVIDTPQLQQRTPAWHAARKDCLITGSMVDTLLNNNPLRTYYHEVNLLAGVSEEMSEANFPQWKSSTLPRVTWPKSNNMIYIALDVEHSGGIGPSQNVIQLASLALDGTGKPIGQFNEFVHTSRLIFDKGKDGKPVHGITNEKLDELGAKPFAQVGKSWHDWLNVMISDVGTTTVVLVAKRGFGSDFVQIAKELVRNNMTLPAGCTYLCIDPENIISKSKHFDEKDSSIDRALWGSFTPTGRLEKTQKSITTYILKTRDRFRADFDQHGDDVFEAVCGSAHDALADVKALQIMLTDAMTVWNDRGKDYALEWCHFMNHATAFVKYENDWVIPTTVDPEDPAINHGKNYEDEAREKYIQEKFTSKGIDCLYIEIGFVKHPDPHYRYMGASPDALLLFKDRAPILLEIKCPYRVYESRGKLERSNMNKYRGQIQLQMHVMGVDECHFVQYNPGTGELISDVVFIDPDFMKNPIFPQFVADVQARKTRSLVPLPKSKKRKLIT